MAELLTVDEVKSYLRIDYSEEDILIVLLITSARNYCEVFLNRPILVENMTAENEWEVPESIRLAMLMLVAHWYENRGAIGKVDGEIAFSVTALLTPYRWFTFGGVST
jgi:uncharacterized phage protein (predicted DNA packaging)